jgi:hypothetical protein
MKRSLLFYSLIFLLASCSSPKAPKEVAQDFIQAVYTSDEATASGLATEKTKSLINESNNQAPATPAAESFSFATLNETVSGNSAEVKNDRVKLQLEKGDDGWKVAANPELVAAIRNREADLSAVKGKWDALVNEYNGRLQVAKDYLAYKKGQGALSPPLQTLEETVNGLSVKTSWDKEKIRSYLQKQELLEQQLDKALEPSFTAGADMSMNYILQVSNASDRIKKAGEEYSALAARTPSSTYPTISMKAATSAKGN